MADIFDEITQGDGDIFEQVSRQPSRQFGSAVEGGPVEADEVSEFFRQNPNLFGVAGAVGGITEAVGNIPGSTLRLGKDIAQAVTSPRETARAIGTVAKGGLQKLTPGVQSEEEIFNAVAKGILSKYGSLEAFSEATISNPIDTIVDLSVLAGGTGALARIAGTTGKATKVAKTASATGKARGLRVGTLAESGETLQRLGRTLDPLASTINLAAKTVNAIPIDSLVKTALDFPKAKGLERIDELADAFLSKGLNVTRRSLNKVDKSMIKVRGSIDSIIDKRTAEGVTIKTEKITAALDDLIKNANREGLETRDLAVVAKMRDDFLNLQGATLTPKQLQDLKIGFNKNFKPDLGDKFGQVRNKARAKMRVAAKEQLEDLHPQLKALNEDSGVMIELDKVIRNRIISIEKKPIIPVRGLVAGAGGGAIAGGMGADLGMALKFGVAVVAIDKVITDPRIQIAVAKAINKVNQANARAGKFIAPLAETTTQASRIAERAKEAGPPEENTESFPNSSEFVARKQVVDNATSRLLRSPGRQ